MSRPPFHPRQEATIDALLGQMRLEKHLAERDLSAYVEHLRREVDRMEELVERYRRLREALQLIAAEGVDRQ